MMYNKPFKVKRFSKEKGMYADGARGSIVKRNSFNFRQLIHKYFKKLKKYFWTNCRKLTSKKK